MVMEVAATTSVKAAAERHDAPNTASASAAAATVLSPILRFIFVQIPRFQIKNPEPLQAAPTHSITDNPFQINSPCWDAAAKAVRRNSNASGRRRQQQHLEELVFACRRRVRHDVDNQRSLVLDESANDERSKLSVRYVQIGVAVGDS